MAWWVWILIGMALSFAEIAFTPGVFVLLFFGVSAFFVAVLVGAGLGGPFWVQVAVCAVLSLVLLGFFRQKARQLLGVRGAKMDIDTVVGGMAIAREELAPGASGKVEYRGSSWNASNAGTITLYPGDHCRIQQIEGLQLSVKAERE